MRSIALTILVSVFLTGCSGGLIRPKIEQGIEKALPSYIGPARKYDVRASGSETDMLGGRIASLQIAGTDVQIAENLTVAFLVVDMNDVSFHTSSRKLKSIGSTTFRATLTEKAVNDYVNASRQDGSDMRIELETDKLTVVAKPSFHGVGVQFKVTGTPEIDTGTKVSFVADSASLSVVPVPAWIVNRLLNRVNPVLDLEKMKFPVKLSSASVRKDSVELSGSMVFKP